MKFSFPKFVFGLLSLVAWFSSGHVWDRYVATRPRTPDPGHGYVYALHNHGTIVFLTASDCCELYGLMVFAGLCFLVAGLMQLGQRRSSND